MNPKRLQAHITASYTTLRIGMAVLAIALPFLLWIAGHLLADLPLQGSMSAYYHAGGVVVFGSYWLLKSFEIRETHAERQAVEGQLTISAYSMADFFKPITVKRVGHIKGADPEG